MKIRIDGRELLVRKRVRDLIELQRQTGWKLEEIQTRINEADGYSLPVTAFLALANAGFAPSWEELLDREADDFEQVEEPGDTARAGEDDASDPQNSRADSDPGGDEPAGEPED